MKQMETVLVCEPLYMSLLHERMGENLYTQSGAGIVEADDR